MNTITTRLHCPDCESHLALVYDENQGQDYLQCNGCPYELPERQFVQLTLQ